MLGVSEEDVGVVGEDAFDEFEAEGLGEVGEAEEGRGTTFGQGADVKEDEVGVVGCWREGAGRAGAGGGEGWAGVGGDDFVEDGDDDLG